MSAQASAPVAGPVRIGCSGWIYKHWRGLFYPQELPVKRWFAYYASEFDTVEINNSFYRLPKPETFEAWKNQAPPGFCYAVKANRFLTQAKKLKDCEEPLERQMRSFYALRPALGPILYQLPPRFRVNPQRLESFLRIVPKDVTNVFEFREPSWYTDEVFALLERYGASFCAHDMPGSHSPRLAIGPVAYLRFHGGIGKILRPLFRRGAARVDRLDPRAGACRKGHLGLFQQRSRSPCYTRRADAAGDGAAGSAVGRH